MKKQLTYAYIALGLVSFFWGTTYIAARISAKQIPGLYVSATRQFIAGLLMVLFFKLRGLPWPDKRSLLRIGIQGFFLLFISNGLLTWAIQFIPGGLAAIIAGLVPLFIALFSVFFLKHAKFTLLMLAGLLVGFAGIIVIFYDHLKEFVNRDFTFGIILSFIATVSWSFGSVYSSKYKQETHILFSAGLQMLIAGSLLLPICFATRQYSNLITADHAALLSIGYLIVFGSFVAYTAYVYMLKKLPAAQTSVYAYINPIVAIFFGWLLLDEKMSSNIITGSVITIGGVFLVNKEFKKQQPKEEH
ncbi:MAG: EamA family transporter [Chitinophagaceae bacterium]|nr:EamA family transporter [Chitinophagaceae bacterium]